LIPGIFCPGGFNLHMGVWGIWLILCLILPQIPFVTANKKLRSIKKARGWYKEAAVIYVNTEALNHSKWIHPAVFLILTLLPLLSILIDSSSVYLARTMALSNLIIWICYRFAYRDKSEMVDGNLALTRVLTQIRRREWGRMFLVLAASMALLGLLSPLMIHHPVWSVLYIILFGVVISWASIRIEMRVRKLQEKLTAESGKDWYVDEDDHWLWGFIYYNPEDSSFLVNQRTGIGTTVNLARPAGKILWISIILLLLWMPFAGVSLDYLISSEITITRTDTEIVAESGQTVYSIPTDEIAEIKTLDVLPEKLYKVYGTNTERILKGDFTLEGIGSIKVCVNQGRENYLLIKTNANKYYLINAE
ncbi:MAG: hypothetical protein KBT01_08480, partial [Clostridiales bacterium]|nr:hypothetical protein [Candidatus Blautia equi]